MQELQRGLPAGAIFDLRPPTCSSFHSEALVEFMSLEARLRDETRTLSRIPSALGEH